MRFVRENWIGILGLLVGLGGVLFSWYTFVQTHREPRPIFLIDPSRTQILSHENISRAPISVLRADGRAIKKDLTSVRFFFWNDGTDSIRHPEILQPITITIDDPEADIVQLKLLRVSRAVTGARAALTSPRTFALDFNILEPKDGLTG